MGLWDGDTPGTILHGPSLYLILRPPALSWGSLWN